MLISVMRLCSESCIPWLFLCTKVRHDRNINCHASAAKTKHFNTQMFLFRCRVVTSHFLHCCAACSWVMMPFSLPLPHGMCTFMSASPRTAHLHATTLLSQLCDLSLAFRAGSFFSLYLIVCGYTHGYECDCGEDRIGIPAMP